MYIIKNFTSRWVYKQFNKIEMLTNEIIKVSADNFQNKMSRYKLIQRFRKYVHAIASHSIVLQIIATPLTAISKQCQREQPCCLRNNIEWTRIFFQSFQFGITNFKGTIHEHSHCQLTATDVPTYVLNIKPWTSYYIKIL